MIKYWILPTLPYIPNVNTSCFRPLFKVNLFCQEGFQNPCPQYSYCNVLLFQRHCCLHWKLFIWQIFWWFRMPSESKCKFLQIVKCFFYITNESVSWLGRPIIKNPKLKITYHWKLDKYSWPIRRFSIFSIHIQIWPFRRFSTRVWQNARTCKYC